MPQCLLFPATDIRYFFKGLHLINKKLNYVITMSFICILSLVNLLPLGRISLQAELRFCISSTTELNSLCLIFWKCSSLAFIFRSMLLFFNMEVKADRVHFHHEKDTVIPPSVACTLYSNSRFLCVWLTLRLSSGLWTSENSNVSF